jgi:transcriptional regulator with XRE-family HTH domain
MSSETAISRWLQKEMPRRGYPVGGPRAGGISRLAEDAGIPQGSMSRIVNGRAEPGIDSLRKIGKVFGVPLNEMLIHAEMADESDFALRTFVGPVTPVVEAARRVQVPRDVPIEDLEPYKQHLWFTPDMTAEQRATLISLARLLVRPDIPGEAERLDAVMAVLRALAGVPAVDGTRKR